MPRQASTGCLTCRIRRIKCSEEKPSCVRCTSTGRTCDGYPAEIERDVPRNGRQKLAILLPAHKENDGTAVISPRVLLDIFHDEQQRQCFDFYRYETLQNIAVYYDPGFWSGVVVHSSLREPAIMYSLIALGSLHMGFVGTDTERHTQYAMLNYSKAVQETGKLVKTALENDSGDDRTSEKILIASLVLHVFALVSGDHQAAIAYLKGGMNIYETYQASARILGTFEEPRDDQILAALTRLEFQLFTRWQPPLDLNKYCHSVAPGIFTSVAQLGNSWFDLARWLVNLNLIGGASMTPYERLIQRAHCRSMFRRWEHGFKDYMRDVKHKRPESRTQVIVVELYWLMGSLVVDNLDFDPEMQWDAYETEYEQILSLVEEMLELDPANRRAMSEADKTLQIYPDCGIVFPIYMVSVKARNPRLRRRAINLMFSCRRREGITHSDREGRVAKWVMQHEEEGLPHVEKASDIPYHRRVKEADIDDQDESRFTIGYVMASDFEAGDLTRRFAHIRRS